MKRIKNVQTNPFVIGFTENEEEIYEDFEADDNGRHFKVMRSRVVPVVKESIMIAGTHHAELHNPEYVDISNAKYENLSKQKAFMAAVDAGKIQVADV